MKVYLDNIMVDPEDLNNSLKHPVITQQRIDETGDRGFSFTGELEFSGKEYAYLYKQLKTDPNALENRVVLKMVDDCCSQNLVYEFWLSHETLQWCENECTVKVSATEKSDSVDQYTCFKNTIIWDNHAGFQSVQHPRFSYCNELRPNWLHDVLIVLIIATWTSFLVLGPILIVIATIITVINFIITINNNIIGVINSLPGGPYMDTVDPIDIDGDPSTNAYSELDNWVKQLLNQSFGCGRKHPSPLVKDYIMNVCSKCGISFTSSIYNDPNSDYYWAAYVNAPINKGTQENDGSTYWIPENAPILSGLQLLDQLAPVTNSKFAIKNNTLYFERRDFFIPATPWLDLTTHPKDKIKSICWSWSTKSRYSYASLYYQKDGINWVGSEAVARWGDIVEWNSPYSPLQKGEYKPLFQFAAQRFRDDGIDRDVLTFYEDLPTVGPLLKKYKNAMLMNSHQCFTPMLLIWDPDSGTENAFCNKFTNIYYAGLAGVVGANQYYNYPYWFKQGYPGNLYDRFHEIENPRTSGYQGLDFVAEIEYDCNLLSLVDVDGTVRTSEGDTTDPTIITIDREKGILIIKGTV